MLTSRITEIYKVYNNIIKTQREEMKDWKKKCEFEIYMLVVRVRVLELENRGSA